MKKTVTVCRCCGEPKTRRQMAKHGADRHGHQRFGLICKRCDAERKRLEYARDGDRIRARRR